MFTDALTQSIQAEAEYRRRQLMPDRGIGARRRPIRGYRALRNGHRST